MFSSNLWWSDQLLIEWTSLICMPSTATRTELFSIKTSQKYRQKYSYSE